MALLSGVYLFVEKESVDCPVEISRHSVETGVPLSDHVRTEAMSLHAEGLLVGSGFLQVVETLRDWQSRGLVLDYVGCYLLRSVQIEAFSFEFDAAVKNGCKFSLSLRQLRVAQSLFAIGLGYSGSMEVTVASANGMIQVLNLSARRERYHTMQAGETLWYLVNQYRIFGVSTDGLIALNKHRDVFVSDNHGDFSKLRVGASLLLGVW